MENIISVKHLSVTLHGDKGKVHAVNDVTFQVGLGETLVVVGESGCGKTVMSKSILNLLRRETAFGENSQILFNGKNLVALNEKEMQAIRGNEIAMIFQDPMSFLNPTMTVGEQIMESLFIHKKLKKKQAFEKCIALLEQVKISDPEKRIKQYPHEFSGGMRQRIIIAMALACKPKLLIADEPTTALDVTIQAEILDLLLSLQKEMKMSIIFITHDLGVAAEIADRIQVMYAGEIVESGPKRAIFDSPKHPYTQALLKSIPALNKKKRGELYSLEGTPPPLNEIHLGCPFLYRCQYAMKICEKVKAPILSFEKDQSVKCWKYYDFLGKEEEIV